jgi:uncharacterized protein YbaP (TraB family)
MFKKSIPFLAKITRGGWILSLLLVLFLQDTYANSSVWQVSKSGKSFYLAGSIHLLSKDDYPLPKAYQQAYQNSEALVLEIDLGKTTGASFQRNLLQMMSYPIGERLQHHLSKKTYLKLRQHFQKNNKDLNDFSHFKAGYISMLLTIFELQKLNMAGTGVDQYFFNLAEKDQKMVVGLESLQTHFEALASMGDGYEDELIEHSLNELKILQPQLQKMKQAWRSGDLKATEAVTIASIKTEFPELYQRILVARNQAWLPKIASLIHASKTSFILIGNAHLAGKEGLIHQLKLKGFTLKQLP